MAELKYHYETMGRILTYLVKNGLKRGDIEYSDAKKIMGDGWGNGEDHQIFSDIFFWMSAEGLIRHGKIYSTLDAGFSFLSVQLTSKGLAVINTKISGDNRDLLSDFEATIEQTINKSDENGLSSETYGKIGSLVGGFVGGLSQSF